MYSVLFSLTVDFLIFEKPSWSQFKGKKLCRDLQRVAFKSEEKFY